MTPASPASPTPKSATPYADARRDILNVLAKFDALLVLRDSLAEAADVESVLAKHTADVASAKASLDLTTKAILGAEAKLAEMKQRVKDADADTSNQLAERRRKFREDVEHERSLRDNAIVALQAELDKYKATEREIIAGLDAEITAKQTALHELETKASAAQKALADAKARVGGL